MISEKIYLDNTGDERTTNERRELDKYNKHVGDYSQRYFVVFRIGKKYKSLNNIKQFEYHMLRKGEVINADSSKTNLNRILIGSNNIVEDVRNHIYGIKLRSNANVAVEMVLTVNHKFFDNLAPGELDKWIQCNIDFLNKNFGDNVISAVLHQDELAPHFHILLCPRFWNEERKRYELSSNKIFGSKKLLRDWQTKYADHMHKEFNNLIRGIRGSKARHMDIKTYYSLINKKLNEKDNNQVLAYAKYGYLAEKRIRMLENTVMQIQADNDDKQLLKRVEAAEKQTKEYKEVTKAIINKYGLKKDDVIEVIDKIQGKSKGRER